MSNTKRTQLLVLIGALALTAVLYILPQKAIKKETDSIGTENRESFSFESLLTSAKGSLKREEDRKSVV